MFSWVIFPFFVVSFSLGQLPENAARSSALVLVKEVQRADYEGDRKTLKRLFEDLAPFADNKTISAKIHYWRGFALWRRALNGFNESASHAELEQDLSTALSEFEKATALDLSFMDAKSASASCLQNLAFLHLVNKDGEGGRVLLEKSFPLLKEAEAEDPENPRLLWVLGASRWYTPPERGGGQAVAIATYEKGLRSARQQTPKTTDPLMPSWGEPELLMNLAWANFNKNTPNLETAERYASSALVIVPSWHYVRDILLPQIRAAMPWRDEIHPK